MAKEKKPELSEAHKTWLSDMDMLAAASAEYERAKLRTLESANALAKEKEAEKKNAVEGPGGVIYRVMKARAEKDEEGKPVPPPFPLVLRKAQTLTL